MWSLRGSLSFVRRGQKVPYARALHATSFSGAKAGRQAPAIRRRDRIRDYDREKYNEQDRRRSSELESGSARMQQDIEEALPPIGILQAAFKSGAMGISAEKALEVLRRYQELERRPSPGWEARLCNDFDIEPATLVLLSKILNRCPHNSQRRLARVVMFSASGLGDESATVYLVSSGMRNGNLDKYSVPLQRLETMAKHGNPRAMTLLGRVAASQGRDGKALEWFRKASQQPGDLDSDEAGEALVCEGQILKKTDVKLAEVAFKKAALELDYPSAYFYLSQLEEEGSPRQEVYLLKAASSGIIEASHMLGSLELDKVLKTYGNKAPNYAMAREWFQIAAVDGFGPSMLSMAEICKVNGELEEGLKWLSKAKLVGEVKGQAMVMEDDWTRQPNLAP